MSWYFAPGMRAAISSMPAGRVSTSSAPATTSVGTLMRRQVVRQIEVVERPGRGVQRLRRHRRTPRVEPRQFRCVRRAPSWREDALGRDLRRRLGPGLIHRRDPRFHVVAQRRRRLARSRDQHQRRDQVGTQQGELLRHHAALRQPDDADALETKRIRQGGVVAREHGHVVGPGRLVGSTVAARVHRDHAVARRELFDASDSRANGPTRGRGSAARQVRCRPPRSSS